MTQSTANARALAGDVVTQVLRDRRSLSQVLPHYLDQAADADRALVQELAYGVLRWRFRLEALLRQLLKQPLKRKDQDVVSLLLVGLYQLTYTDIAAHAAVHESVEAVRATGKRWAVSLANAVLRSYQRQRAELETVADKQPADRYAHPEWLVEQLRVDWPDDWERILAANNQRPPFVLRVNARHRALPDYCAVLAAAGMAHALLPWTEQGLCLERPVAVERLPGFAAGEVSVQDAAAQLAAPLLAATAGMRVLDVCAAPGGKAAHIMERTPDVELIAVDIDASRAGRIEENFRRLGVSAQVLVGDAARPEDWWDKRPFQRILLDAPCSASGVIRRHPDIKSLRRAADISVLAVTQAQLLNAVWPLLEVGGLLLYATCSVLRRENSDQIEAFLSRHEDARAVPLDVNWGRTMPHGRQILPGNTDEHSAAVGMDGFFYASLIKLP
ncbi:MAG TPA: 16S rRNA (cytosine(967)-C(5))-methyltransferase RsmB [Gammaproteobacteria bacterium]|nr:16S rRNA (cytosine(967)-C(5))-methyltransferase RsmB [Gammaproteobacteria bacterium]